VLAFEGEIGVGTEQGRDGVVVLTKPVEKGNPCWVGFDLVAEVWGWLAEVVFGGGEDARGLVRGVCGDEQAGAGGGEDADGASATIEGIGRGAFGEVADEEDGTAGALGQVGQGSEDLTDLLVTGGVNAASQHGHERVQDDQAGVDALNGPFQEFQIVAEGEGTVDESHLVGIETGDGGEQQDAGRIAARSLQAGSQGVTCVIFRGDQDDASLWAGGAVGHGQS